MIFCRGKTMQTINRSEVVEAGGGVGGMNLQSTEDLGR